MNTYRIILADNHEMFRQGVRNIVCQINGVHIIGETGSGYELMTLVEKSFPDLVIMGIDLEDLNGLEVLGILKQENPGIKVLILTSNKQKELILKAINREADGFILKEEPSRELTRAIENIRNGNKFFSALISSEMVNIIRPEKGLLSIREKEIMQFLAEGVPNDEIADSLKISIYTLYRHRHNIKRKLHFRNQAEMIKYAVSNKHIL
jgi:DNA-binding NarL/FixJ family response regulator